jgi:hypothetical protein
MLLIPDDAIFATTANFLLQLKLEREIGVGGITAMYEGSEIITM